MAAFDMNTLLAVAFLSCTLATPSSAQSEPVRVLFDSPDPRRSPFPSDTFTVPDPDQNTGRRVALPQPADCRANQSECHDVSFLNRLDGSTRCLGFPFRSVATSMCPR
jgi:hypothetical protein